MPIVVDDRKQKCCVKKSVIQDDLAVVDLFGQGAALEQAINDLTKRHHALRHQLVVKCYKEGFRIGFSKDLCGNNFSQQYARLQAITSVFEQLEKSEVLSCQMRKDCLKILKGLQINLCSAPEASTV